MKRGRNQRRRQGVNPNRALDSNGPDVRIRGTANQIHDKYIALARDASSAGDRIKAESYLQHAEHYFRLIRSMQPAQQPQGQSAQAPAEEGESEQPTVEGEEENRRPQRGRRAPSNNTASEPASEETVESSEAVVEKVAEETPSEEPAAEQEAAAEGEEKPEPEKKPRRRRTTRRTTKRTTESASANSESADAAAAE